MALRSKMKLRIEQALLESGISVHPAVAQKWPVRPMPVDGGPVNLCAHDFFPIDAPLGDNSAIGPADKALPPKFNSVSSGWLFVTNAIGGGDKTAVRDRVTDLDCFPGRVLGFPKFLLLAR